VAYQAAHGIDQLGVVGPATRAALNAGATATTASPSSSSTQGDGYVFSNFLDVGSSGQDVTELQQRLTTLNLYSGPITGYFGSLTQAAVAAFQGQHSISAVGYVGPATRAALNGN
jgi:peptidoglycan hydrolase-like protein with peptidoglycan-binding domain